MAWLTLQVSHPADKCTRVRYDDGFPKVDVQLLRPFRSETESEIVTFTAHSRLQGVIVYTASRLDTVLCAETSSA